MLMKRISKPAALVAAVVLSLTGCGSSDKDASGLLTVKLTDSPVDRASEVVVVFTGIELKHESGPPFSIDFCAPGDPPAQCRKSIDLLTLQDGVTVDLLDEVQVEAGRYEWIRLKVLAEQNLQDGSYIVLEEGGAQYPLWVPSGAQTGLKLVRPFVVAQGGVTELVIDFDLRKSVLAPPGLAPNYILKPTLRLVDKLQTGTIVGTVDLDYLAEEQEVESCVAGVYLFKGVDAVPDDMDGGIDGNDPVVYKPLEADELGGVLASYIIPFVEAGEYTVAFTCNFDVDASPEESEYNPNATEGQPGYQTMAWTTFGDVVVASGQTTEVDFLPSP
jgi:hypothetical protein